MEMQAAVFRKVHEPLTIESVEIDKPWGREVLVRTAATGVCHSDLHVVDGFGRFPLDRPIVLGHEGAGVVEAVGADVTTVRPGRPRGGLPLGLLRQLRAMPRRPPESLRRRRSSPGPTRAPRGSRRKAQPVRQFIGISSYAEQMLLHENSIVKIDPDLPLDRAALVGCGVLTGVGAALRSARGSRPGKPSPSSAAAGSGCRSSRARGSAAPGRSSASTSFDGKREMAKRAGATHVVNSSKDDPGQGGALAHRAARGRSRLRGGRQHHARAPGDREPRHPRHGHDRRRPAAGREDRVSVDGDPPGVQGADLAHGRQPVPHRHSDAIWSSIARAA